MIENMQRPGHPNASIKLYEDYSAWLENRFVELGVTFTTLTLRDGLYGRNEGILQFYDAYNLHTKMNGDNIIQISLANANNTQSVKTRIYGCKNFAVSVDAKGDNIIAVNLEPLHHVMNQKFSRAFFANATESVDEMIRVLYTNAPKLAPGTDGINIAVPRVAWSSNIKNYMEYVREVGLSVDQEQFVFVWEDFEGIHLQDYLYLTSQEAINMIVGDQNMIGEYTERLKDPLCFDFEWLTKANPYVRNPLTNATFYSHSFNDKTIERITTGAGENSVYLSRSGGYSQMTYRNGYEEALRLCTMAQYDGYATTKMYGNFDMRPGLKINFMDQKRQFKTDFYVDEVVHEINSSSSITHLYMFTHAKKLEPVELVKVKSVDMAEQPLINEEPLVEDGQPLIVGAWDLNRLAAVATVNAAGRKATGDCALYVRRALEAAQKKKFFSGGLGHANQMATQLMKMGWAPVGQNITSWQKGDISVFQRTDTELGRKYGHIAIFNGATWVSDFIQKSVQPNSSSRLPYTIYRVRQ